MKVTYLKNSSKDKALHDLNLGDAFLYPPSNHNVYILTEITADGRYLIYNPSLSKLERWTNASSLVRPVKAELMVYEIDSR